MRERRRRGRRHLCILNRGVERETGYLPPRAKAGCDAFTRAESVRLDAFMFTSLESLSIDRSCGFGGEKKTFASGRLRAGAAKFWFTFTTLRPSFFYESSVFCFSITHQIIRKRNRLVSMPPVKPPSYTNLSSGKS
jgi:hypothetical protein